MLIQWCSLGQSRAVWHYLCLFSFDVVIGMWIEMLKPLIFDHNEQEYHSAIVAFTVRLYLLFFLSKFMYMYACFHIIVPRFVMYNNCILDMVYMYNVQLPLVSNVASKFEGVKHCLISSAYQNMYMYMYMYMYGTSL